MQARGPGRERRAATILLAGLVGWAFFAQSGLAADGDLDPTFGTGGKVVTSFDVPDALATAVALQPDGKIVAAGWLFDATANVDFAVARYNPDGSLDPTFDFDGRVRTDFFGGEDVAQAVVIQPDGKILVAGGVRADPNLHFGIARYTAGGSLDPTFDGDGKAIGTFFGSVEAMLLQPDGKIVVAGSGYREGTSGDRDITLVRYNTNGALDASFGVGGIATTDVSGGQDDRVSDLLPLPAGKLLVIGTYSTSADGDHIALVRYNADGSLDATFGDGGKTTSDFRIRNDPADAAIQPDGKIVVAVALFNPTNPDGSFSVARFLPNGDLDPGFGSKGKAFATFPGFDEAANAVAIQTDGKIVAAGFAFGSDLYDFALVRFNTDGSQDATFGPSGAGVVTDFFGVSDMAYGMLIQPDGKIVAAGVAISGKSRYFAMARYLATPESPAPPSCPRSYGYWRSHPEEWPVTSLVLGSQSYALAELTALLHELTKGDASVILARQLITAKLNLAAGAGSNELTTEVAAADAVLGGFAGRLPYRVSPSSASGRAMVDLAGRLAKRNNRGSGRGCGETNFIK